MMGQLVTVLKGVAFAVLLLVLAACETTRERPANGNAPVEKRAATAIGRICALPKAQREAELKKIKEESGMMVYCGK